jgi:hypothetical protein
VIATTMPEPRRIPARCRRDDLTRAPRSSRRRRRRRHRGSRLPSIRADGADRSMGLAWRPVPITPTVAASWRHTWRRRCWRHRCGSRRKPGLDHGVERRSRCCGEQRGGGAAHGVGVGAGRCRHHVVPPALEADAPPRRFSTGRAPPAGRGRTGDALATVIGRCTSCC